MNSLNVDQYAHFAEKVAEMIGQSAPQTPEDLNSLLNKLTALKEDDTMLNLAIDNCADSFHIADAQGTIQRVNHAFERRAHLHRAQIEGRTVSDMEKDGIYSPSVVNIVRKEKRKMSIVQSGPGGDVITTANPVFDQDGTLRLIVSNARFVEELELMNRYTHERSLTPKTTSTSLIAASSPMKTLLHVAQKVALTDSSIFLTGETGCGKSLIAKFIHDNSNRRDRRFIEINCAAIPEALIESELFGYESGAFTGAKKGGKPGLIELAHCGTLFLDEIGDMPLNLQVKLLQVLQNRTITRVGGEKPIPVNVRILTATNRDLTQMIEDGAFRSELYYRINVVPLHIPPLRQRKEDISPLIHLFLERFSTEYKTPIEITKEVEGRLQNYKWPGNIRELENLIERLVVTNTTGCIDLADLPNPIIFTTDGETDDVQVNRIVPLKEAVEKVEKQLVLHAFKAYGSSYKAAAALQISQSSANRKYLKYKNETDPEKT